MNFFISDNHWQHKNIIQYCNRPFRDSSGLADVHYMNRTMTEKWNSVVGLEDTVYHLGDFSMGNPGKYREKLNGKIVLILGNHDRRSQCQGHFDEIHDSLEIDLSGNKILLSHLYYSDMLDNNFDHKFKDKMPKYDQSRILIHGHAHNSKPHINEKYKAINVSAEHLDYIPMSETKIIETINQFK